jgi:chorismate mutase
MGAAEAVPTLTMVTTTEDLTAIFSAMAAAETHTIIVNEAL